MLVAQMWEARLVAVSPATALYYQGAVLLQLSRFWLDRAAQLFNQLYTSKVPLPS